MDKYVEVGSRNEEISPGGFIKLADDSEFNSKGFFWARQATIKGTDIKIESGVSDLTNFRWLVRYGEWTNTAASAGDYIKYLNQYYKILAVYEATEYGRNRAVWIETNIENRQFLNSL
jgi:hypothetical protein